MRILVVEDEVKMADLIRKGLERDHYSVMTTHTGTDGLSLALAYPFDAIVLDVAEITVKAKAVGLKSQRCRTPRF